MVWCTASNCKNSNRKSRTIRFYSFPTDPERRKKWEMICHRDNWQSTKYSKLCEKHFEENQFERNRKDGWRKLKPNAIPTLCYVPGHRKKGCGTGQVKDTMEKFLSVEPTSEYLEPQTLSSATLMPGQKDTDQGSSVHFDELQFEQNRKDGKRKLKPNAIPTIYETAKRSVRPFKRNRVSLSDLPDRSNRSMTSNSQTSSCDEDHPAVKKMKKSNKIRYLKSSSSWKPEAVTSSWKPRAVTGRIKAEVLDESVDDRDDGHETDATGSSGYSMQFSLNGSTREGSPGMASNRSEALRSTGDDRLHSPSISLEQQMHNEEENLLKEWDTTVRCRQENSLSIRPVSLSTDDAVQLTGTKAKPRFVGSTPKTSSTVNLAAGAVKFEFPEIDIVKRHDTSLDDGVENVEDDSRRFTYTECPTTGRKTIRLEMNVEGFEPKDITVKSFDGRLTIHGIAYDVRDSKKSTNEFCRKIKLPDGIASESLRCTFCDHVLVLEAPVVRTRCSTPDVAGGRHPLNLPVVLCDENGRYLSLVVELGRIFRPSDVVVKVKGQQTICIFAETVENTSFSRMKAKIEREFDLPEKIDQKSLRAGCTEDRLLKIVARIKDPNEQCILQKAVRIDIGDSIS